MTEHPMGRIIDGLGNTLELDDGDLVVSALVIAKVVDKHGDVSLALSISEALSWIDQNGLLTSAQQIVNQTKIVRNGDAE